MFTVGALDGGPTGFRAYRTGHPAGDQLVAVWDHSGTLTGVIVGDELGPRRTGALGAVAADALALGDAHTVAVIGSGQQAWTQLWALTAVRDVRDVRVFSPHPKRRQQVAERAAREFSLSAMAVDTPRDALTGAELVILATRSQTPVIDADDVKAGAHVITVGPKSVDGHETPVELADRASVITCDSPAQAGAYAAPFFTDRPLTHLGAILTHSYPGRRTSQDITLHCSVGLSGTEVLLAQRIIEIASSAQRA